MKLWLFSSKPHAPAPFFCFSVNGNPRCQIGQTWHLVCFLLLKSLICPSAGYQLYFQKVFTIWSFFSRPPWSKLPPVLLQITAFCLSLPCCCLLQLFLNKAASEMLPEWQVDCAAFQLHEDGDSVCSLLCRHRLEQWLLRIPCAVNSYLVKE